MWWKRPKVVYIDTRILFLKIILVVLMIVSSISYWRWTRVTKIEFASEELASSWIVSDKHIINDVSRGLMQSNPSGEKVYPSGIRLKVTSMRETKEFLITDSGLIIETKNDKVLRASKTIRTVVGQAQRELKRRSPFGEIVNWRSVKQMLPVGEQFKVRDLQTGKIFKLKRTGGYSHADVEPVNPSDTRIIKELYGGHLTWKRRAVIVELKPKKIAASFTGATEGNGEIRNNGVLGKMNLHFINSDIDDGRDLSHRVTIWKAAGKSRHQLKELNPEKTIMVLFTAIDQQDPGTLNVILDKPCKGDLDKLIGVTVQQITKDGGLNYRVIVSVSLKDGPYNQRRLVTLRLYKNQNEGRYRVDGRFIDDLFSK